LKISSAISVELFCDTCVGMVVRSKAFVKTICSDRKSLMHKMSTSGSESLI
jgi:hypothetical protein